MDPVSISLAFAAAQAAVKNIKAAMQLGKDINSLLGEFSNFFSHADTVHVGSSRLKQKGLTNAEINRQALETAMHSRALREAEKDLKDMLYWSGNADVWVEMMAERVRLMKERNAAETAALNAKTAHNVKMADMIMNAILAMLGVFIAWICSAITWTAFTK